MMTSNLSGSSVVNEADRYLLSYRANDAITALINGKTVGILVAVPEEIGGVMAELRMTLCNRDLHNSFDKSPGLRKMTINAIRRGKGVIVVSRHFTSWRLDHCYMSNVMERIYKNYVSAGAALTPGKKFNE